MKIMNLCSPALLYLILSSITVLFLITTNPPIVYLAMKITFVAIWTWFLHFLCRNGFTSVSWILVLLPVIVFIVLMILVGIYTLNNISQNVIIVDPTNMS